MSRTKRAYNDPARGARIGYHHPYQQVCMGRCPLCRDAKNKDASVRRKRLKSQMQRDINRAGRS